jgi:hypothetical protein
MLPEGRAKSCTYDRQRRTARIEVGPGGAASREGQGTLLLDAHGAIVGVDVAPASPSRIVVMVGVHEAVATTRDVRISISRDVNGELTSIIVYDVDPPA